MTCLLFSKLEPIIADSKFWRGIQVWDSSNRKHDILDKNYNYQILFEITEQSFLVHEHLLFWEQD